MCVHQWVVIFNWKPKVRLHQSVGSLHKKKMNGMRRWSHPADDSSQLAVSVVSEITGNPELDSLYRRCPVYQLLRYDHICNFVVFAAGTLKPLTPNCWWRDEAKDDRCRVLFTAGWLVNAARSAKERSGSEIRRARAVHSFNLVDLTKCIFILGSAYHASVSFIINVHYKTSSARHEQTYPLVLRLN